jgi:hypothetical protein
MVMKALVKAIVLDGGGSARLCRADAPRKFSGADIGRNNLVTLRREDSAARHDKEQADHGNRNQIPVSAQDAYPWYLSAVFDRKGSTLRWH